MVVRDKSRQQPRPAALVAALTLAAIGGQVALRAPEAQAQTYGDPYSRPRTSSKRLLDDTYSDRRDGVYAPAGVLARPGIWNGFYLGASGGWIQTKAEQTYGSGGVEFPGSAFGLYGGYNAQFGHLVLGVEADGSWLNGSGSKSFGGLIPTTFDVHAHSMASLRLRLGLAVHNVMAYVTAGPAMGSFDLGMAVPGWSTTFSDTLYGYAAGGGVELKLAPNWSGRIEALHYGFEGATYGTGPAWVPTNPGVTTVRAGVTFHFN